MRITPTNEYLHACKIVTSSLCDFCDMNIENFKHLFWECPKVQAFWSALNTFINGQNIDVILSDSIIWYPETASFTTNLEYCNSNGKIFYF